MTLNPKFYGVGFRVILVKHEGKNSVINDQGHLPPHTQNSREDPKSKSLNKGVPIKYPLVVRVPN